QCLHLADVFLRADDPDEALATVYLRSGRSFGPASARAFSSWFHLNGGEVPQLALSHEALEARPGDALALLDTVAGHIDEHNAVPGRWRRVHTLADATAAAVGIDAPARAALNLATRLFGAGEVSAGQVEDAEFDPLSRLGIDERAKNAQIAAALVQDNRTLGHVAEILQARAEWYDGTGKPANARHESIPIAARILAAAIAYDTLQEGRSSLRTERNAPAQRIDTAAGTQFDPSVIRALLAVTKAHA
ncbi:MAG: HD domain-containing phosphohydrolase, partial [Vulcanimicrobiaceae bacterium]